MRSPVLLTSTKLHPNQPQNIFTDVTSTIYAIPPYSHLPQTRSTLTDDIAVDVGFIPEDDCTTFSSTTPQPTPVVQTWDPTRINKPHPIPLRPHLSSTMICTLANPTNAANIGMLQLHLLYTTDTTATMAEQRELQEVIAKNFHDLAVLSALRWRLGPSFITQCNGSDTARARACLPFQLGAVDVMKDALARDQALEGSLAGGSMVGEGEGGEM